MTRHRLTRTLRRTYVLLGFVLAISLGAKLAVHVPGVAGTWLEVIGKDLYDYLKDMALVLVTVVAAYLAQVFQRRSRFTESLEQEWRQIVRTKTALLAFLEKPYPSTDDYIVAFGRISESIDTMRIVYRNAGETKTLVGLFPYAPLHDMRRVLQAMDPRLKSSFTSAERGLAQRAISQCFAALRENFLEELDLSEPDHPLLISGGRRTKVPGQTPSAQARQVRQRERNATSAPSADVEVDAFLGRLHTTEAVASTMPTRSETTAKP
jgi:hypothetical protein